MVSSNLIELVDIVSWLGGVLGLSWIDGSTGVSGISGPNRSSTMLGWRERIEGFATGEVTGINGWEILLRSSSKVSGVGGSTGLNINPWSGLRGRVKSSLSRSQSRGTSWVKRVSGSV